MFGAGLADLACSARIGTLTPALSQREREQKTGGWASPTQGGALGWVRSPRCGCKRTALTPALSQREREKIRGKRPGLRRRGAVDGEGVPEEIVAVRLGQADVG